MLVIHQYLMVELKVKEQLKVAVELVVVVEEVPEEVQMLKQS
jgi:hypothetical protein